MPATGYTTAHMAADLAGLLDQLGLSRIHLVGHSFGGAVALHFALLHPQRVRTLTLADCRIHSLQPFPSSEDGRFWRARRERLRERDVEVKDDTPKVVYTMLEEFGPDGLAPQADGGNGLVAGLGVWNPQSRAAQKWLKLRSTTTLAADVRRVAGLTPSGIRRLQPPALLMFGEESRCLKTCARLRRLLPAARAVLLPGVGHFFPVQVPERFVEELKGFLDPVPPSPAMDAGEAPLIGEAVRPA
jgi:pimeloyl-ACP methyl ester carboxylesterase